MHRHLQGIKQRRGWEPLRSVVGHTQGDQGDVRSQIQAPKSGDMYIVAGSSRLAQAYEISVFSTSNGTCIGARIESSADAGLSRVELVTIRLISCITPVVC